MTDIDHMIERFRRHAFDFNVILWVTLFLLLIGRYVPGVAFFYHERFLVVVAYMATIPVVISALRALLRWEITVDLLASIALFASLAQREWLSVIFINLMIASANIFSAFIERRSRASIEQLLKLKPVTATVERNGMPAIIPVEDVIVGDRVYIRLGERVPVDGVVEQGEATIDQASLTGESMPVVCVAGDRALSATVVVSGSIVIRADHVGDDTTFEKMVALIKQAQRNKANISTLSERFGKWYIVVTLLVSVVVYALFRDLPLVLSLLLVSCADDVAIAIPTAFLATISTEARQGVIVKGGDFLERLSAVRMLIVDKTGTLTKGQLRVEEAVPFGDAGPAYLLKYAGMISCLSHHPSARAIVRHVEAKHIVFEKPDTFVEQSGKGAVATYGGKKIIIGKHSYLQEHGIDLSVQELSTIHTVEENGYNATLVALEGTAIGMFALADEIREDAARMVADVRAMGIDRVVMLTGDNERIAMRVAKQVGIVEFHANLLPEDKLAYIKKSIHTDYTVAMIGDGVNDAAALTLSDIGIAMGAIGTDVAIEAADIALMKDDLAQIPRLIEASRKVMQVARQDLFIWGAVNVLGLILVFAHVIGPSEAAFYNFITDFIPIANSVRLFRT